MSVFCVLKFALLFIFFLGKKYNYQYFQSVLLLRRLIVLLKQYELIDHLFQQLTNFFILQ